MMGRFVLNQETFKKKIKAWQDNRNANSKTREWKFTTKDALVKLKKLYPTIIDTKSI